MRYDELFPETPYLAQRDTEINSVIKGDIAEPCWHCGTLTTWMDLEFQAYLCSEECAEAKWDEYFRAWLKSEQRNKEHQ